MSNHKSSLRPIWDSKEAKTHVGVICYILLSPLGNGDSEHDPSWGKKKEEVRGKRDHGPESTRRRDSRKKGQKKRKREKGGNRTRPVPIKHSLTHREGVGTEEAERTAYLKIHIIPSPGERDDSYRGDLQLLVV